MPERIGKFEIVRKLGQGGMGEVYLAVDPGLGREVALKTMAPALTHSEGGRERFLREARAAGTLNHPNLVTIYEFGEDAGVLFLVMELLPGEDLTACLKDHSLTPSEALEVMAQVCDGLGFAHGKGIIHRDIKPSNVRVWREDEAGSVVPLCRRRSPTGDAQEVRREDGRIFAKVLDFGVARLQDSDLTQTGMLVGTFQYMAPEYLQTKKADARCDLFAVGVMLHEALLGNRPEPGPTTPAAPRGVPGGSAPLPEPAPGLDPRFLGLVEKAVALDPSQRYQSAAEFSRALRAAQDTKEVEATEALQTAPPHRLLGPGDTIFPSLVTAHPVTGKKVEIKLPPLPAAEPEPWWQRHWGWGVVLLAVLGVARWGLGPESAARPNPAAPPPPAIQEQKRVPPNSAQNPDPRWALPAGQERGPEPFPRPNPDEARQPPGPPPMAPEGILDEARSRLRDQPREALEAAQKVLRTQQGNVHAHALVVAGYYRLHEYDAMLAALKNAKANGVDAYVIGGTAVLRELLREEGQAHRIPPNLFDAMRPYLPPPPEESSQQGRPRGEDPHYPR